MRLDAAKLMRHAVRLARRSPVLTSPNPPVGAIVLDREGQVAGQGWHEGPGTPHAEIVALASAGTAARDGTLVVTLAPCTRQGLTPPCIDAVVASGVRRVLVGVRDPNPAESYSSVERMQAAGLEVQVGLAPTATEDLVEGFASLVTRGRPRITAKLALSLDGRVAATDGSSRWVTGPQARREVHRLRGASDAVLVGAGTVRVDDPDLTVRLKGYTGPQPARVVLDPRASLPTSHRVFQPGAPTLLIVAEDLVDQAKQRHEAGGIEVLGLPAPRGRIDLAAASTALGSRGMLDVLVESGPTLVGALVEALLIDRILVYLAPKLLGADGAPAVAGLFIPSVADAVDLRFQTVRRVGADLRLEGRFVR